MQKSQHCFAIFETCIPKPPSELNIGKASSFTQREAIIAVLAGRWIRDGVGLKLIPMTSKSGAFSILFDLWEMQTKKTIHAL
jgi:hypothetical protein